MPTTASLPAFLKSCDEIHFLLQKTMMDYFLESWWSRAPRLFLPCLLPTSTTDAELFSAPHELLIHLLGSVVQVGMAEFLPSSLPVWHLDRRAPGDSPSLSIDESYPSRLSWGQKLFLVSPEIFLFFNFSDVLNKFLIIEANRCSLASILGLTWL